MGVSATWLVWSAMMNFIAGIHVDSDRLRFAARNAGVPEIVMEAIAAVETGYRGGNEFLGKAGEIGRMQIKESTARGVGCGEPVNLADYEYNIACGAKILRHCRNKYPDWPTAVRCYQGMAVPESTKDYLLKVQREIGRLTLAQLDEQFAIAASKAPPKRPARAKKPVPPPVVPVPLVPVPVDTAAKAVAEAF